MSDEARKFLKNELSTEEFIEEDDQTESVDYTMALDHPFMQDLMEEVSLYVEQHGYELLNVKEDQDATHGRYLLKSPSETRQFMLIDAPAGTVSIGDDARMIFHLFSQKDGMHINQTEIDEITWSNIQDAIERLLT